MTGTEAMWLLLESRRDLIPIPRLFSNRASIFIWLGKETHREPGATLECEYDTYVISGETERRFDVWLMNVVNPRD